MEDGDRAQTESGSPIELRSQKLEFGVSIATGNWGGEHPSKKGASEGKLPNPLQTSLKSSADS